MVYVEGTLYMFNLPVCLFLLQECQLDLTTVAYAFVYFEKLILKVINYCVIEVLCQEFTMWCVAIFNKFA